MAEGHNLLGLMAMTPGTRSTQVRMPSLPELEVGSDIDSGAEEYLPNIGREIGVNLKVALGGGRPLPGGKAYFMLDINDDTHMVMHKGFAKETGLPELTYEDLEARKPQVFDVLTTDPVTEATTVNGQVLRTIQASPMYDENGALLGEVPVSVTYQPYDPNDPTQPAQ